MLLYAGDYIIYGTDEDYLLPDFPLDKPAAFQILESDCKMNATLADQLREKYMRCPHDEVDRFVSENLADTLTAEAAAVFSWSGKQGTISVMKFKIIKILIGIRFVNDLHFY